MSTASPAAIDDLLDRYTTQVGSGFGLIQGDVQATFGILMTISLGVSALLWALDEHENVPAALVRKILLFGFFAWLISGWRALTLTVVNGFAALGLKAGGGRMTIGDLMQPSRVVHDGLDVAFDLLKYIGRIAGEGGGLGFFNHIDAILITGLSALGIVLAYIVLGIEIAVTVIEFYVVTLIGFVTVPFGILTKTAFMAERAIGYVVSVGAKVMALALVVSIGEQIFASYVVSPEPAWEESCGLLLAALLIVMLALKLPALAAALITGGPQLSAGSAAAGAVGLAATVGGLALAGRWAMGAGAAGSAASARSASRLPSGGQGGGQGGGRGGASGGSPPGGSSGDGAAASGGGRRAASTSAVVGRARASYAPPAGANASSAASAGGLWDDPPPEPPARAPAAPEDGEPDPPGRRTP
ncbi:P-type conjugative transfer protein TrbL [Caulobacter endophyticus]|uniref:P-type conjugative transfer protein TrbL n=1 Tax=Caulobacter endophyticus TaxID=2172652 RepID=UPI00240F6B68|nr:P-type conjugative transfer protein TrbL [Caulobacter endophyticus]MDG2528252.1 P-type conjugative transfer protein TrbL [Caulobacter endophyticus]